ncbi:MAG: AAA family ATPase [Nitrososphaeria archaeon]
MKINKIFAEDIKTFPRLDLYLEDYNVALITGPNGVGKTTAFVTIPMISFYGEFSGRSIKDYALPSKESKIGIEFEYDHERYAIVRQYYGESSKSVLINLSQGKKITRAREIELQIERLFGMDRQTFLSTVVIAQGEVETLSERSPRERRELFLRFLDVDFKKAYEKAKENLNNIEGELKEIDKDIAQLELKLQDRPQTEGRIPQIESEIRELETELSTRTEQKDAMVAERNKLGDQLGKLRERLRQLEPLTKKRVLLAEHVGEFSEKRSHLKKEEIEMEINKIEERLLKLQKAYPMIQQRDMLSKNLTALKDIVRITRTYADPTALEEKIKKNREHKTIKEAERSQLESRKTELLTKRNAASLYMASIDKYSICPVCDTHLSQAKQIQVISKIKDEVTSIPLEVAEIEKRIQALEEDILKTDKEITLLTQQLGESKTVYEQLEKLTTEVDVEYKDNPEQSINKIERALKEIVRQLEENVLELGFPASTIGSSRLVEKHVELSKEKTSLQKLYGEYEEFERNLEEIKEIDQELKFLESVEQEIQETTRRSQEIEEEVRKLEMEISTLNRRIGSRREELSIVNQKLVELKEKEKVLDDKRKEHGRLSRKRDILAIVKEEIFKDDAFPTVYLREFVKIVQANLRDFISRFKSGRYEIDMGITETGDIEVRARDRYRKEAEYRPLETFSQGERTIIGFAIRLATMRAISQYKGKNMPNVLIVDEGFGPLDQENIRALVDGIRDLSEVFEQIFIITHIEQLKGEFDQRLVVEETPSGSIVRAA